MIGANLKSFVTAHDKTDFKGITVLKETNITGTTFFPFIASFIEAEKFGTTKKRLQLQRKKKLTFWRDSPPPLPKSWFQLLPASRQAQNERRQIRQLLHSINA